MQSTRNCYLGIDVSKLWFDVSLILVIGGQKQAMVTQRFDNTSEGVRHFGKWLKTHQVPFDQNTLVVMENTGVYHRLIWQYCTREHLPLYLGNAAAIKWSLGIVRGKSDRADSQRLCTYCYRHAEELKATPGLDAQLVHLKDLMSARSRLLSQINSIRVYLGELKAVSGKEVQALLEQTHKAALEGLRCSLKQIEEEIKKQLRENAALSSNYELLLSVPGIGHLTAVYLICCTANFASGRSGKQLACYAGVVPFESTSGSSIKGRNKVHKMANKDLKKLLHLGALSAVKNYPEFKAYYERKKQEGKHPMTILNAVRNKIALRAAAVVKQQRKYRDNYQKAA